MSKTHEGTVETESARSPAPGALAHVQEFVNSADPESGTESLGTVSELRRWLVDRDLARADDSCTEHDLLRARVVREALRAILEANNDASLDPRAIDTINRAARDATLRPCFDADGYLRLEPTAEGVDGAIGRLLAIVFSAMADGTWGRLKACRSTTCRWAFYDHSRNHSGAWCTMATCGSREKARAYRHRRRGTA